MVGYRITGGHVTCCAVLFLYVLFRRKPTNPAPLLEALFLEGWRDCCHCHASFVPLFCLFVHDSLLLFWQAGKKGGVYTPPVSRGGRGRWSVLVFLCPTLLEINHARRVSGAAVLQASGGCVVMRLFRRTNRLGGERVGTRQQRAG